MDIRGDIKFSDFIKEDLIKNILFVSSRYVYETPVKRELKVDNISFGEGKEEILMWCGFSFGNEQIKRINHINKLIISEQKSLKETFFTNLTNIRDFVEGVDSSTILFQSCDVVVRSPQVEYIHLYGINPSYLKLNPDDFKFECTGRDIGKNDFKWRVEDISKMIYLLKLDKGDWRNEYIESISIDRKEKVIITVIFNHTPSIKIKSKECNDYQLWDTKTLYSTIRD